MFCECLCVGPAARCENVLQGDGGLVSEETMVLRRWGSDTRKFGLSTELIM